VSTLTPADVALLSAAHDGSVTGSVVPIERTAYDIGWTRTRAYQRLARLASDADAIRLDPQACAWLRARLERRTVGA